MSWHFKTLPIGHILKSNHLKWRLRFFPCCLTSTKVNIYCILKGQPCQNKQVSEWTDKTCQYQTQVIAVSYLSRMFDNSYMLVTIGVNRGSVSALFYLVIHHSSNSRQRCINEAFLLIQWALLLCVWQRTWVRQKADFFKSVVSTTYETTVTMARTMIDQTRTWFQGNALQCTCKTIILCSEFWQNKLCMQGREQRRTHRNRVRTRTNHREKKGICEKAGTGWNRKIVESGIFQPFQGRRKELILDS